MTSFLQRTNGNNTSERSDGDRCKDLWGAVILRAISDASGRSDGFSIYTNLADIRQARDWLAGGSRDLMIACDYAGIDFSMLSTRMKALAGMEWPRATVLRMLGSAANAGRPPRESQTPLARRLLKDNTVEADE